MAPKPTKEELSKLVVAADAVLEAEKKVKRLSNPERRPWLYVGDQKMECLSSKQLRSEVRKTKPQDFYGKALRVILDVMLESQARGINPFPR